MILVVAVVVVVVLVVVVYCVLESMVRWILIDSLEFNIP